jgi:hypothetical protein
MGSSNKASSESVLVFAADIWRNKHRSVWKYNGIISAGAGIGSDWSYAFVDRFVEEHEVLGNTISGW